MKGFKKVLAIGLAAMLLVCNAGAVMAEEVTEGSSGEVTIYLIRHGQTLFNLKEVAQGWCDSPLTDLGVNQAKQAGVGLADVDFTAAYSSVSERAMDTAQYVLGERDIPLQLEEGLKEMNFGVLEGESNVALWAPDFMTRFSEGFTEFGGETVDETTERAMASMKAIAEANPGGTVLVASHGLTIMFIAMAIDGEKAGSFMATHGGIGNCAVTLLKYADGEFTLESIGDESYRDNGAAILEAQAQAEVEEEAPVEEEAAAEGEAPVEEEVAAEEEAPAEEVDAEEEAEEEAPAEEEEAPSEGEAEAEEPAEEGAEEAEWTEEENEGALMPIGGGEEAAKEGEVIADEAAEETIEAEEQAAA